MYVLQELNAYADERAVQTYGVELYPNFAVVDAKGEVRAPPGRFITDIIMEKPPVESAAALMSFYHRSQTKAKRTAHSADVNIAVIEFLKAHDQPREADDWLERALANTWAKPEELVCLKVYKALALRRGGETDEGLRLLQEVAPELKVREATAEEEARIRHGVAPFVLGRGEVTYGIVSSDADARLTWEALSWLGGLDGDIPEPEGLDEEALASGAIALATVLNRPADAGPWLAAYRATAGGRGFLERLAMVLVDGIVMCGQGRHSAAASRLIGLVKYAPAESFSPLAGTLACEAARKANEDENVRRCAQLVRDTYGALLPERLLERFGE